MGNCKPQKQAFSYPDQLNAFKTLLENMTTKASEYISADGEQTTTLHKASMVLPCHTKTSELIWGERIISQRQTMIS